MLRRFKHIESVVFFLFLGAWVLQTVSPVLLQQVNQHHDEIMVCNTDGDCGSMCSKEGKKCSCSQTTSDKSDGSSVILFGCDHNGNQALVISSPFKIKAIPLSGVSNTNHTGQYFFLLLDQKLTYLFVKDILRPPRLMA